jgi:hypothetical protein
VFGSARTAVETARLVLFTPDLLALAEAVAAAG